MRQFNTIAVLTDGTGSPINGTITFYKHGTQTQATITDVNGTAISNPQQFLKGRTQTQVFLPNEDIDYVVKDLDGAQVTTGTDLRPTFAITSQGDDVTCLTSNAGLVATMGINNGDIARLTGYYAVGDMGPVEYTWTNCAQSSEAPAEDGGSIVWHRVNNTYSDGYWTLIPPATIEAAVWGCTGDDNIQSASLNRKPARFTSAQTYATSYGKPLTLKHNKIYFVETGTYTTVDGILVSNNNQQITIKSDTTKATESSSYRGVFNFNYITLRASQMQNLTSKNATCKDFIMDVLVELDLNRCNVYPRVNLAYTNQHLWTQVRVIGVQSIVNTNLKITKSFVDPSILSNSLTALQIGTIFTYCSTDSLLWSDQTKYTAFANANKQDYVCDDITCDEITVNNVTAAQTITAPAMSATNGITAESLTATRASIDVIASKTNKSVRIAPIVISAIEPEMTAGQNLDYYLYAETDVEQVPGNIVFIKNSLAVGSTGNINVYYNNATTQQITPGQGVMFYYTGISNGKTHWQPIV